MKNMLKVLILTFGVINYVLAQNVRGGASGEASVGESGDASVSGSASGSASIDCDSISDGLPSCECLSGSISGSADNGVSGSVSEPGINCVDNTDCDIEDGQPDGLTTYVVDVERNSMMITTSNYVEIEDVVQADADIKYIKEVTKEKPFRIYAAKITVNWKPVWDWDKQENTLANACDDSFPEGTVEANIFNILNPMIYNNTGCTVAEGSVFTMPPWLRSFEMKFDKPVPCGSYSLDIWLQTPIGNSAGRFWFDWKIPQGSNCLPDVEQI